jgi:hypothetical protein
MGHRLMPVYYEPQPPPHNVSNVRLFSINWCCAWAGFWFKLLWSTSKDMDRWRDGDRWPR